MRIKLFNMTWARILLVSAVLMPLVSVAVCAQMPAVDEAQAKEALQTLQNTNLSGRQKALRSKIESLATAGLVATASDKRTRSDSVGMHLQISLLTCGRGDAPYEYYGHSAIRVLRTDSAGLDLVFNYGVFDFNSDNFLLRFSLGETDYLCAVEKTADFIESYRRDGRYIDEQVLNLTQSEARRLYEALLDNVKPQNAAYRYNFFYDNCATRVRDIIERNVEAKLQYPERPVERTLRDAVHFYCRGSEWSAFGQDLVIGAEADIPASGRELEFVPLVLQQDFGSTVIIDQTHLVRTFVTDTRRLLDLPAVEAKRAFPLSPLGVAVLLVLCALVLGIYEYRKKRIVWAFDTALLLIEGIAGAIVAFMFFFSIHPTVGSNWLVWILNPLPLVGLFWQIKRAAKKQFPIYHAVAGVVVMLFLMASFFIPQKFGVPILLLALVLLIRNATNLLVWRKMRNSHKVCNKQTNHNAQ